MGFLFIDGGDFACLEGEQEKECPGRRLRLNAGELEALVLHVDDVACGDVDLDGWLMGNGCDAGFLTYTLKE